MTQTAEPEWGFLDAGKRPLWDTAWRRTKLFVGIAGRTWHAGRIGPITAWRVCQCAHPWREQVKKWGIVNG